jgi:predicted nucleic acid-binding protein
MKIVSNASPLINLARIGQLDLLQQLYGQLTIPEAVWHEVVVEGAGQPGAKAVEAASWIQIQPVTNRELVQSLRQELDAGEAEAIALALEMKSDPHQDQILAQHAVGVWAYALPATRSDPAAKPASISGNAQMSTLPSYNAQ